MLKLLAMCIGLELLLLSGTAALFAVTDGALFNRNGSLGYMALAGMIILIILITFVIPILAVVHEHRTKRRRNPRSSQSTV